MKPVSAKTEQQSPGAVGGLVHRKQQAEIADERNRKARVRQVQGEGGTPP